MNIAPPATTCNDDDKWLVNLLRLGYGPVNLGI